MNWRLLLVLGVLAVLTVWREWAVPLPHGRRPVPEAPQPSPEDGDIRSPLPGISSRDPEVSVGLGRKTDATGTAFALSSTGWWMTARHVVDQCARVHLRFPRHRGLSVSRVVEHPRADLALLLTTAAGVPLVLSRRPLFMGQNGFQVGYPHGAPGEVWSTLLGRHRMRVAGRYRTNEPVVAWAEQVRRPDHLRSLGGLSGGPALDGAGGLVGVLVAESRRRGRLYTAAPASVAQMLIEGLGAPDHGPGPAVTPATFAERAEALRNAPSVAKVVCLASQRARRG